MSAPKTVITREFFRGDTHLIDYNITNSVGGPYDLTGATLWFSAKTAYALPDNQSTIALSTTTSGVLITNAKAGQVTVTIPPIATRALPDGNVRLVYDLQLQDALGRISTIEVGLLIVKPDVTRTIGP